MGNSLPLPCVCHDANKDGATAGAKKRRRRRRKLASRNVVPVDTLEDGDGEVVAVEEEDKGVKEAWPGCRVEPAGYGEDGGVRVRIVMKRKDVAELVARLEQRGAAERNDRMEELNAELGGGSVTVTMSPCRDAWRPRLSSIPETY